MTITTATTFIPLAPQQSAPDTVALAPAGQPRRPYLADLVRAGDVPDSPLLPCLAGPKYPLDAGD